MWQLYTALRSKDIVNFCSEEFGFQMIGPVIDVYLPTTSFVLRVFSNQVLGNIL